MTLRLVIGSLITLAAIALFIAGGQSRTEAVFPGTNGRIVFVDHSQFQSQLSTMNPDGSDRTQVPTENDGELDPAFSPDGEMIIYRGWGGGLTAGSIEYALYITDGAGTPTMIPNTLGDYNNPTWSPDGQSVIFVSEFSPAAELYSIEIDGTGLTQRTDFSGHRFYSPDWSPRGDRVAFALENIGTSNIDIWLMDPDGSNQVNITNTPDIDENWPSWSPDGQRIIFSVSDSAAVSGNLGLNIAVMDADGSNVQEITSDPTLRQTDASFSPDGQQVLWAEQPLGVAAAGPWLQYIVVADADGSNPANISPEDSTDLRPYWGVDEPAPTLIWGDNDCSGEVNAGDSLLALRLAGGLSTDTGPCPGMSKVVNVLGASDHPWGDVNCDGQVAALDALYIALFDAAATLPDVPECPEVGAGVLLSSGP